MNYQFRDENAQDFASFDWLDVLSTGPVSHSKAKSSDKTPPSPPLSDWRAISAESTAVSKKKSLVESAIH